MATKSELSSVEWTAPRVLEMRRQAMQRAADELVALKTLSRATAIAYIEKQRGITERNAAALSGMGGVSDPYEALRRYDASRTGFGRLLFFLRFRKCPTDAAAEERALCAWLAAEIAKSERQKSPRAF